MNLATLDRLRHRIPFWWWLTYDALVAVVIVLGVNPSDPAFWLGFVVLGVAVVIDTVEFVVKRPSAVAKLAADGDELDDALDLLALWFSRFQGYTAGTPEDMVVRTTTMLRDHDRAPKEGPRQHG